MHGALTEWRGIRKRGGVYNDERCRGQGEDGATDGTWKGVMVRIIDTEGKGALRRSRMRAVEWLAAGVTLGRAGCSEQEVIERRHVIAERL